MLYKTKNILKLNSFLYSFLLGSWTAVVYHVNVGKLSQTIS